MKKILVAFMLLFGITYTNAQVFNLDFNLEPKPYAEKEYFGEVVANSLKSIIQINTVNVARGISNDTLWKYEYDKAGKRTRTILYSKNRVNKVHDFTYEKESEGVVRFTKSEKKLSEIYKTVYDDKKNIVAKYSYIMNIEDTLHIWATNFKFREDKLLLRENKIDGNYNGMLEYSWNKDVLSKATFYSDVKKSTIMNMCISTIQKECLLSLFFFSKEIPYVIL